MEPVRGGGGDRSGPREGEGRGRYGRANEEADGERYSVWHGARNGTRDRFRGRETASNEGERSEERGWIGGEAWLGARGWHRGK